MNVITLASRKGGAGKSTLTAQLAAQCHIAGKRTLIIDADPQGSLSLWHSLRKDGLPKLVTPERGIERAVAFAMIDDFEYVFIDTAPTMWVVVQEAIRAATLTLIPARPGFFDLAAVRETVKVARERDCPYAVVVNAAPVKRDDKEAGLVAQSRAYFEGLQIPVWAGQISQRAGFQSTLAAGASAAEIGPNTAAGIEVAKLWAAVEKSVEAINSARFEPGQAANEFDEQNGRARGLSPELRGPCHRSDGRYEDVGTSVLQSHEQTRHCGRISAIGYPDGHNSSARDSLPVAGRRPCFQRNKRKQAGLPRSANQEARAWESSAAS